MPDVIAKFASGLLVAIEAKLWAGLQLDQLHRYERYLKREAAQRRLLVFLAPALYHLPPEQRLEQPPVRLTYRELERTIADVVSDLPRGAQTERVLLSAAATYFSHLEIMALTPEEIVALSSTAALRRAERKLQTTLSQLGSPVEVSRGRYMLVRRITKNDYPLYGGVRYGTDWYFSEPLYQNGPEAVVYLKDVDEDKLRATRVFEFLDGRLSNENHIFDDLGEVKLFRRDRCPEVRLAVFRALSDPQLHQLDELRDWILRGLDSLEILMDSLPGNPPR